MAVVFREEFKVPPELFQNCPSVTRASVRILSLTNNDGAKPCYTFSTNPLHTIVTKGTPAGSH